MVTTQEKNCSLDIVSLDSENAEKGEIAGDSPRLSFCHLTYPQKEVDAKGKRNGVAIFGLIYRQFPDNPCDR
jgi:hypothetical protein